MRSKLCLEQKKLAQLRYRLLFEQKNLHKCGVHCLNRKTCTKAGIFEMTDLHR